MHFNLLKIYIIIICIATFSFAKEIDISTIDDYYNCSENIKVLFDPDERYGIENISLDSFIQTDNTAMGYAKGAVWTKIDLINTKNPKEILVVSPRVNINIIEAYIFKNDTLLEKLSLGNYNDINNNAIQSKYGNLAVYVEPNTDYSIVAKFKSNSTLDVNWILTDEKRFLAYVIIDMFFWGILGGLVISLIIYNVSIFKSLKDHSYLAYVFHGLFALIFQFATNGVFYQFGLYQNLTIFNSVAWISAQLSIVCSLLFVMLFFNTKKTMTKIHKIIVLLIVFTISMVILFSYSLINVDIINSVRTFTKPIALLSVVFLVVVGFIALKKKIAGSLYYLAGHGVFMISLLYQQFSSSVINHETTFVSIYITAFAMLFDIVFLSLALSQKVEKLKYEKEKNEKLLISQSSFSAIGRTVGNLSHQWKVPIVRLGSLIMQMEAMLWSSNHQQNEQLSPIIDKMRKNLEFMDDSIKEFNGFYNNVSKEVIYKPADEIGHILDLLSAKISYTGCTVISKLDEEIQTFGYKNAFANVCLVIIDNALDIFKQRAIAHPQINIKLVKENNNLIKLTVKDNGCGITIEPIEKIFDVFVSDKTDGNGMGLAMVKVLVKERLNGNIYVHNNENGAEFEVVFSS